MGIPKCAKASTTGLGLKKFMTASRTSRSTITVLIVRPAQSAFFETPVDAASADMNYCSEFLECEPGNAARRSNLSGLDAGALNIDHPGNAEPVGEHAEAMSPEGFAEGHGDGGFFRERAEDALGVLDVLQTDVDAESLWLRVAAWRRVGGHKHRIPDGHASVENFLLPFSGNLA